MHRRIYQDESGYIVSVMVNDQKRTEFRNRWDPRGNLSIHVPKNRPVSVRPLAKDEARFHLPSVFDV